MSGFVDPYRMAWGWWSNPGQAETGNKLCGTLTIQPRLSGEATVTPRLNGQTSVEPRLTGTTETCECC